MTSPRKAKVGAGAAPRRGDVRVRPARDRSPYRGLAAGLIVVAIGCGAVWWFTRLNTNRQPTSDQPTANRTIAEIAPSIPTNKVEAPVKKADPRVIGKTPTGKDYIVMKAETNSSGIVTEQYQLTDGKWMQVVQLQTRDSAIFDSDLDLQLAIIAKTPLNRPLPPFPHIKDYEKAFEKAIQSPIIVRESDNEHVREMKEAAIAARLQIKDLMDEGYTIEQILSDDNSLRQKNIEFRHTFQSEVNDIYRKEGKDAARKYLESANEKLEKLGIIPLTMPGTGPKKRREAQE